MDNKKWYTTGIIIVGVLLAVFVFTFSISVILKGSLDPIGEALVELSDAQKDIQKQLAGPSSFELKQALQRIDALERDIAVLKAQGAPPAAVNEDPGLDLTTVHEIPVEGTPVFGSMDAPITITVFNDFQCPFCARFHPAMMEAVKAYPGKVKFMLKHFPLGFHSMASPAAKAALTAGAQGKYYEMADELFNNAEQLSDEKFKELAGKIGLNVDQFMKDYKDRDAEWEAKIKKDMELAVKVGVRGTPSYYINGRATMARMPDQWKQEIDAILAEIQK